MKFFKFLAIFLLTVCFCYQVSAVEIVNVTLETFISYDRLTFFTSGYSVPLYEFFSNPPRYLIRFKNSKMLSYVEENLDSLSGNVIERIEMDKTVVDEVNLTIFFKTKTVIKYRGFYFDRCVFDFFATNTAGKVKDVVITAAKEEEILQLLKKDEEDFIPKKEEINEEEIGFSTSGLKEIFETKPDVKEVTTQLISLSFIDADFRDVITAISKLGDLNIIIDDVIFKDVNLKMGEEVKGELKVDEKKDEEMDTTTLNRRKVTVNFKNVPIMVALELILKSQGLWYTTFYGNIFVTYKEKIENEFSEIRMEKIQVEYADAYSIKKLLEEMKLIHPPISVEVYREEKAKDSKNSSSLDIASQYAERQSISAFRTSERSVPNDEIVTSKGCVLIIYGTKESIDEVKKIVSLIDLPPKQVFLETAIIEISERGIKDLGLAETQINPVTGMPQEAIEFQKDGIYGEFKASNVENEGGFTIFSGKWGLPDNFNMILKTLIQNNEAKVLNRPIITTTDGQPALIEVGNDEPIIKRTTSIEAGIRVYESDVNFRRVGVSLLVTPRIDSFNEITLYLNPVLSETQEVLQFYSSTGEMTLRTPVVGVREANTIVRVKNGESVIIGGLMREEKVEKETKIPILSSAPLIGDLFKRKYKSSEKSEIFIIITPFIKNDLQTIPSSPILN